MIFGRRCSTENTDILFRLLHKDYQLPVEAKTIKVTSRSQFMSYYYDWCPPNLLEQISFLSVSGTIQKCRNQERRNASQRLVFVPIYHLMIN